MLSLGPLAFAAPWLLLALGALPLIWWLLRITPPAPKRALFPPVRILREFQHEEETPEKTPWWLLLLRLLLAALIILALAHPLVNPRQSLEGSGPLVVVVDDGWTAAHAWRKRIDALADLLSEADRQGRPVALVATATKAGGAASLSFTRAAEAREVELALEPVPWAVDHRQTARRIEAVTEPSHVVWLSDGIAHEGSQALAERLAALGPVRLMLEDDAERAVAMLPPTLEATSLKVHLLRVGGRNARRTSVRGVGPKGEALMRQEVIFEAGEQGAEATLDLPAEIRNRLVRLAIEGVGSAGAVTLIDERWRRRPVGLVSGGPIESAQPLLSELYYLERALEPFSEVHRGSLAELMKAKHSLIVLADVGQVVGAERDDLRDWIERGGVLIRFAGPRVAERVDDMIPVTLRQGGRHLGGVLSWSRPARLAPFDEASPFAGLVVPPDVRVHKQVLAEPSLELPAKTWAQLTDGTPLVTGDRRGKGWTILFHTTANTTWNTLPLSGLFVEMLRRLLEISAGVDGARGDELLQPLEMLDGFGRPVEPPASARPTRADALAKARPHPETPPGFYGVEGLRRALNAADAETVLALLEAPPGSNVVAYARAEEIDLKPWLLVAVVLLALADLLASLRLRGLVRFARAAVLGGLMLTGVVVVADRAQAQLSEEQILSAVLDTRLAYVLTGDREVDDMSRAGLTGLSYILNMRTSVEPQDPIGVDIERDDIVFFPLLYWPLVESQPALSEAALAKLDTFIKTGGMLVFDTRDQATGSISSMGGTSANALRLRRILRQLDVPPLIPIPPDHVLTKAFYLIQDFPGRYVGGRVWVERHQGGVNDGVSALVIGAHDWAAAWAADATGFPLAAVVPGGARQRELAYRFGVNLVMYALTGNYKADQVHVPAILERLGQ